MSAPMPADLPERMDRQAELTDLRHVALCLLQEHANGAYPRNCGCSVCRAAKRWVPTLDPQNQLSHAQSRR